jgi:hypothetical protein
MSDRFEYIAIIHRCPPAPVLVCLTIRELKSLSCLSLSFSHRHLRSTTEELSEW